MRIRSILLGAAVLALPLTAAVSTTALAGDMVKGIKTEQTAKGAVLANEAGMTLYTFAKDKPGMSACTGGCAKNWPPVMASMSAKGMGDFSTIKRDDGGMQWAYKGMPLYTWVKDKKPGDITGDGFKNVWHLARP